MGRDGDLETSENLKGSLVLMGVSSKKRNAQLLASPRRRAVAIGSGQLKEDNNPTNQGTVNGLTGGNKPPKPKVNK